MADGTTRDFSSQWWSSDDTDTMLQLVRNQKDTLNLAIQLIMQSPAKGPRDTVLLPLTLSAVRCCHSLGQIGDKFEHLRDVYIISRSLLEIVINTLFILNSDEEIAVRAQQHAAQKSLRDLRRRSEVAGSIIELNPSAGELTIPADLREAVDNYTGTRGQELRDWTPESLRERIAVAALNSEPKAGIMLHGAFFLIYRHASEMLHGTLFGSLFEMGLTTPDSDSEPPLTRHGNYVNGHLSTVLWADGELVHLLAARLATHLDAPQLVERSKELRDAARETVFVNREPETGGDARAPSPITINPTDRAPSAGDPRTAD